MYAICFFWWVQEEMRVGHAMAEQMGLATGNTPAGPLWMKGTSRCVRTTNTWVRLRIMTYIAMITEAHSFRLLTL